MLPVQHIFLGAFARVVADGRAVDFDGWLNEIEQGLGHGPPVGEALLFSRSALADFEFAALMFETELEQDCMAKRVVRNRNRFELPTKRRTPVSNPWQYAYLITGEKKIGKTTFAIAGCEEYVLQFDKPQLAYELRETVVTSWAHFAKALRALEEAATTDDGTFPFERVVVDGVGEWYQMCMEDVCKPLGIKDPGEANDHGLTWRRLRMQFTDAVNRLLRLQSSAECGLVFIAHSEWKEVRTAGGKTEKLVPNLPARCEEIVNGKVDGWFTYDYIGEDRVLSILGSETQGAGHRIDGHFRTVDGKRVRQIAMGNSAEEGLENFLSAFNNALDYTTYKEHRNSERGAAKRAAVKRKKKTTTKKTRRTVRRARTD